MEQDFKNAGALAPTITDLAREWDWPELVDLYESGQEKTLLRFQGIDNKGSIFLLKFNVVANPLFPPMEGDHENYLHITITKEDDNENYMAMKIFNHNDRFDIIEPSLKHPDNNTLIPAETKEDKEIVINILHKIARVACHSIGKHGEDAVLSSIAGVGCSFFSENENGHSVPQNTLH